MLQKGVSYRETKRLAFPTRRVRPCISSYREDWVGPFPGEGRETCSRKTGQPNDFRLAKEIHPISRALFSCHTCGSDYLIS